MGEEDKNMNKENRNEEAVSPVIATILMVAITVVLAGVLYVWASSLAGDSTSSGGLDAYTFADRDAADTMSPDGGDDLVHVQMTQGDALSWAVVKISIVVDDGALQNCVEAAAADGTEACSWAKDGDSTWAASEEITISEGADNNLCGDTSAGCDVDVTITKIGVGGEDDKIIATVSAYADTN
tara:strand:+ start:1626 stop:2174 length:549 start_codon:yes stop_codon:yes gene_type:complete